MKGPAIFLAQFASDEAPFNSLDSIARWAASLGYKGIQIPSWDSRFLDLKKAAESTEYCSEILSTCNEAGVEITELSSHLQGQLMAVHPAYRGQLDFLLPENIRGNDVKTTEWATEQLMLVAKACANLGLNVSVSFTGSLAFPYVYPWPQRPPMLIDEAFNELGRRWLPVFQFYDEKGVDIGFEIHPGEDVFDGATYEMFLDKVGGHNRCRINYDPSHFLLQQMDYLAFIDIYKERICAFHVKDAEFNPDGRQGVYSGYQSWMNRAGRFRSLGDGQIDFAGIFSKLLQYGYKGWAVLEWECCLKNPEDGAAEGAPFIESHMIRLSEKAFDDFSSAGVDHDKIRKMLGIE